LEGVRGRRRARSAQRQRRCSEQPLLVCFSRYAHRSWCADPWLRVGPLSRAVASSSSQSSFHSSAVVQVASFRRRKARAVQKGNLAKRAERERLAEAQRPHVVVGHRPGDDAKWANCDLAKVIITEEDLEATEVVDYPLGSVTMSKHLNYGVGEREKELLFDTLPQLSAFHSVASPSSLGNQEDISATKLQQQHEEAIPIERFKTRMLARVISLKNANAKGIAFENRRRIIGAFSEPSNPHDPGRPEVQGVFLSTGTYERTNA
jgi:small subunit ribosomal protein S15